MTLDETLLRKLADWRPAAGPQELSVSDDGGRRAVLRADHVDVVGCRLWELTLHGPAPADLKARAEAVAARAAGLLEPLRLLEADTGHGVALLRSSAPSDRGGARHYYEARVHADGGLSLRRYRAASPEAAREQVAFTLTHDALGQLVAQLA
jgi:hypothetical protein